MSIFIIAEIGINHNGDLGIAKNLIDVAVDAGADAVKFQKRTIDLVYTKEFLESPRESPWGSTQREQKEGLEFGLEEYKTIDRYCKDKDIEWLASSWDLESQKFLRQFNFRYNKIASAMIVDIAYNLCGSHAVYESSPIHRRFQDIHAITQQIQGRMTHYVTAGKYFMGIEDEDGLL